MSQRLKRWESPRKEGRNDKGKGGSARQRQIKKRDRMLRQKLKDRGRDDNCTGRDKKGGNLDSLLFYCLQLNSGVLIFPPQNISFGKSALVSITTASS